MYTKLKTCVKQGTNMSDEFTCSKGTRQGCNMSPTLFKMYLNDLHEIFNVKECDPVRVDTETIGCLMYADDVVILSQGVQGLQTSLNNLHQYCKKWKIPINIKKTKIMVFNCRKNEHIFKIGKYLLHEVDRMCYLGFVLTPSGKFRATIKYVYDKACRAFCSIRAQLKMFPNLYVSAQLRLFDYVIKPILLYGSEVWGAYVYRFNNDINIYLEDVKSLFEKLHSKICRYILQVNKQASNYAVRLELGRLPLFVNIMCKMLKYYVNICNRDDNSLVKIALKLHMKCKDSWYKFVTNIATNIGIDVYNITKSSVTGKNNGVYTWLKNVCQKIYLTKIATCNKLALYSKIKTKINREIYLDLSDPLLRKCITQVRISCHKFPIETGRYSNIIQLQRLCTLCKYQLGTEQHCLMECYHPSVSKIRNTFLSTIYKINHQLEHLPRDSLFLYILLFSDKSLTVVSAKYLKQVIDIYPF